MTIFTTRKGEGSGYTLLEILLAMGLCALVGLATVPAMDGWLSEYRIRSKADDLIALVQEARVTAERTGQARVVILLPTKTKKTENLSVHYYQLEREEGYVWEVRGFNGGRDESAAPEIRIDDRGYVEPVSFKVSQGNKYVEYRIDFLTGHAREMAFSF